MLSHCLLFSCGIPSHASTSSSGRHIDFIHGTPLLLSAVRRGRSLSFHQSPHSDCRVLYVDLDEKILFQDSSTDTTAPSHRLLRLSNPGPCAKYLGAVNEYLTYHKVFDRLHLLVHLNLSNNSLQKIQTAYESLDRDITAVLLNAERRSARASYGYLWSPRLVRCGQDYLYWKKRCSDCIRFGDYLASISNLSTLKYPDLLPTLLYHRQDLDYLTNCLQASRLNLNECQAHSKSLRTAHLEERALYAAQTSDCNAEIALNNILKVKEVRRTFQKLRKQAKGQHHSALQRVEIPLLHPDGSPTGSTTSISDPAQLFTAIINQNKAHFSQTTSSPEATGHLSTFIPLFSRNQHTDEIFLAGTFITPKIDPIEEVSLFLQTMAKPTSLPGIDSIDITITGEIFRSSFKKLPENTASGPSDRHLSHYKVLARDEWLSGGLIATMISIPLIIGFAPRRWRTAIQIMLDKDSGDPQIHCLRVIQLLEVDMSLAFRLLWDSQLVYHALSYDVLTKWNFGNLPGASCPSALPLKVVSYGD